MNALLNLKEDEIKKICDTWYESIIDDIDTCYSLFDIICDITDIDSISDLLSDEDVDKELKEYVYELQSIKDEDEEETYYEYDLENEDECLDFYDNANISDINYKVIYNYKDTELLFAFENSECEEKLKQHILNTLYNIIQQ